MIEKISLVIPALLSSFGTPLVPMAEPQRWVGVIVGPYKFMTFATINASTRLPGAVVAETQKSSRGGKSHGPTEVVGGFCKGNPIFNSWDLEQFVSRYVICSSGPMMNLLTWWQRFKFPAKTT